MRREKNPDTICYDHCKGTGTRKKVFITPFSLCYSQFTEFEIITKKQNQNQVKTKTLGKLASWGYTIEKERERSFIPTVQVEDTAM